MQKQEFLKKVSVKGQDYHILDINLLEKKGIADINRLPFSIRILVENLLRKLDNYIVREQDLINIAKWQKSYDTPIEIPHHPARVLMQDFTGVPAVVDLAAMRDAVKTLGGDPKKINPLIPVELVIDHSVQVDYFGTSDSLDKNVAKEYERNSERYKFLKWAQKSFDNFKVVPPNSGICHQVNLEYLGRVIITSEMDGRMMAFPDSLVGTDSHTTMINGIGVMGWGVGGIEAEAVMLGQPYFMSIPEVIGVKMTGSLKPGITATDLVLTVTQILREQNVVEKFVEFFGPGMKNLPIPYRATIANMSPEYGATMGFFPVDEKTIEYLNMTNRSEQAEIVDIFARELNLYYTGEHDPEYTQVLELDLDSIVPSLAGPARPQDRIVLHQLENHFAEILECSHERDADIEHISQFLDESGCVSSRAICCEPRGRRHCIAHINGKEVSIGDGSIVIAAITSCTNTSNPYVLIGAGLLAKKAVEKGLKIPLHVKTSLAPGSRVVQKYLEDAGLMPYFEALGFHIAGFGCTTCIGNSGPLHPQIEQLIKDHDLTVASILSGNRNFEARIHQSIKGNFLGSPILVVGFAIAGRIDVNLVKRPLGTDPNGEPVYLEDIWPKNKEIEALVNKHVKKEFYKNVYAEIFDGDKLWQNLEVAETTTYDWDETSTYIRNPPYFDNFSLDIKKQSNISSARALLLMGDSVTTDHISPAGAIPEDYPAGNYLTGKDVKTKDFNSYGSRRGNHEVMMRGTFGNIRIKNQLVKNKEGSFTLKFPENKEMYIYNAAAEYRNHGVPLIVLGGREYGTGSSRDWAAKGTTLLGIKAVIVESYERIHRSNLVGMGVLPLQFKEGESWETLGLDGYENYTITGIENMKPRNELEVKAEKKDGTQISFKVVSRLNSDIEVEYFENGGILPYVLRKIMKND
ncbi:Aconitate hydratase A [Desulfonema limicola]|uniref:Aconitate hydratase n=1 Tax=Desulfonema limicola TaxID=45656 RepID=A0A975BDM6_9BACT|nr:aconitate hydratase AcnA [Desulfonema limicola]QTA83330.1 Aconitate hydratase A [Desulfonema limicola]